MIMAYWCSNYECCAMWLPTKGFRTSHLKWIKKERLLSQGSCFLDFSSPPLIPFALTVGLYYSSYNTPYSHPQLILLVLRLPMRLHAEREHRLQGGFRQIKRPVLSQGRGLVAAVLDLHRFADLP